MADTIREQIITAVIAALAAIRTTGGYASDCGATVYRARTAVDPDAAPFVNVFPQRETAEGDQYDQTRHVMPVKIEAAAAFAGDTAGQTAEALLGDVIECCCGDTFALSYTAGATRIQVGDTITGATSGASAYVAGVALASGSWAGGDAAGTLSLRRVAGVWQSGEDIQVSGDVCAATASTAGRTSAESRVTGDLAESIRYTGGGQAEFSHLDARLTGIQADFEVIYYTRAGNPFASGE
ncbi:MAG TPA: hypothetical protein ENI92_01890 [Bacteroidetes bacterium]|nr:hypothetical protein [Bacteroidota bacterium]